VVEVEIAGGCRKQEDQAVDIVLEIVRATSPQINTPHLHLNTKCTKEELATDRAVNLLQTHESEAIY
jgi:hypothetical protein